MNRDAWIRTAEIVVLLPATTVLAPLAAAGATGMMFAIAQDTRFGIRAELMLLGVLASLLAGVIGLVALWIAMMLRGERRLRRTGLRLALLVGIVAGIADAVFWIWTVGHQRGSVPGALWIWILMLAGPIVVAVRHALALARLTSSLR